jgi:hypothetical protein
MAQERTALEPFLFNQTQGEPMYRELELIPRRGKYEITHSAKHKKSEVKVFDPARRKYFPSCKGCCAGYPLYKITAISISPELARGRKQV